jgi:hypothetical protein
VAVAGADSALLILGPRPASWGRIAAWAASGILLGLLIVTESRKAILPVGAALVATIVLVGLSISLEPRGSSDVWAYNMYGRIVVEHADNPYEATPSDYPNDPFLQKVRPRWHQTGSVYGPLFTALSAGIAGVAGDSKAAARVGFQLIAGLAVIVSALILGRSTGGAASVAAVGLNPVVLLTGINQAHNDTLVGLACLLGVVIATRGRTVAASALVALGVLIKVIALLPLIGLVLWTLRKNGARAALVAGVTAILIIVAGYLAVGGVAALDPLKDVARLESRSSVWGLTRDSPEQLDALRLAGGLTITAWSGIVVGALALLFAAAHLREDSPALAAGSSAAAYLLAGAYVLPWYAAAALPSLALRIRSGMTVLILSHSWLLLLAYQFRLPEIRGPVEQVVFAAVPVVQWLSLTGAALMVTLAFRRLAFASHLNPNVSG